MYLRHADHIQDVEQAAPDFGLHQMPPQVDRFPSTRFMGSKEQLLLPLWQAIGQFAPRRVLDLCSGSGVVSYMLKAQGCEVISNDQMAMAATIAEAVIANSTERLTDEEAENIAGDALSDGKIWKLYGDLYYDRADIEFLDHARIAAKALPKAIRRIIQRHGRKCQLIEVDHRYSFANQSAAKRPVRNKVKELIFVAHASEG